MADLWFSERKTFRIGFTREIFFKIVQFLGKENKGVDSVIGVYQKIS